jgi:hydrogenase/urease accessory protein HupE
MPIFARLWVAILVVVACLGGGSAASLAHEIRPAIVTATLSGDDRYEVAVALNIEAVMAGIGPQHRDTDEAPEAVTYNGLHALEPDALRAKFEAFSKRWLAGIQLEFDGKAVSPEIAKVEVPALGDPKMARISTVRLVGQIPPAAKTLRWTYASEFGSSVVRLKRDGRDPLEVGWLKDGTPSAVIDLAADDTRSVFRKFADYVVVGFTHIIPKGIDHILFVLGLYLFGTTWRPLLIQVTAFTVAHSITLALGLYGLVSIDASIVEPLIALSIVYVAVENIFTTKMHVWRPAIVFAFGLLHGLGFASVLQEVGLARGDYLVGLIGFNVGVELGQLAVIALAWLATGFWFAQKSWYRQRIVWPASAAIALVGAFWTVERIWFA